MNKDFNFENTAEIYIYVYSYGPGDGTGGGPSSPCRCLSGILKSLGGFIE